MVIEDIDLALEVMKLMKNVIESEGNVKIKIDIQLDFSVIQSGKPFSTSKRVNTYEQLNNILKDWENWEQDLARKKRIN